ncbi:MAG: hypothetical protein IJ191_09145 [Treponema sp.]|nr:hypothetical protein [Treponema sp.]
MKKKTYVLISSCTSGAATIASAIVAYAQPAYTPAIIAAIGVGTAAVNEICALFVKDE